MFLNTSPSKYYFRRDGRFLVSSGDHLYEADNAVVAMSTYQSPRLPPFAGELDHGIMQLHSCEYRNPSQLRGGDVLVVGAGNSGAEIAVEVAKTHKTWLSGRDVGHVPFDITGLAARLVLIHLFVGLHFLHAFSSTMIHGVGRDAERIVEAIMSRARQLPQEGVQA